MTSTEDGEPDPAHRINSDEISGPEDLMPWTGDFADDLGDPDEIPDAPPGAVITGVE